MDAGTLDRICEALPIFPLPGAVLMPGALLPLHVFEPRYRALVRFAKEQDGVLGIATLRSGAEASGEGPPAIFPEIGVGEIVAHQPLPDGRSNIVLQFVGAVEVQAELPTEHPFRLVRARSYPYDATVSTAAVRGLQLMVLQLGGISAEAGAEARRLVDLDPVELVDSLARKALQDPAAQRAYLAAPSFGKRISLVEARLADFMAMATPTAKA